MIDIDAYLERIAYSGTRAPTAGTLQSLHRSHMLTVPFENLDIHLARPIVLDEEKFFEKIVRQRRGGFCYELNGLFAALLRAMNFDVTLLSARVYNSEGVPGPDFDHMTLLVHTGESWIADVGFGDSFVEPLRLSSPDDQIQCNVAYRVERNGDGWRVLQSKTPGKWTPQYEFTLQPRQLADYAAMCHWQQTSPESHFTRKRICSMATPDGRVTLSDTTLIVTRGDAREETILHGNNAYAEALKRYFGFELK